MLSDTMPNLVIAYTNASGFLLWMIAYLSALNSRFQAKCDNILSKLIRIAISKIMLFGVVTMITTYAT
ncbi:MAG: hypothetical protein INQ03_11630 [Candidatus Heimdallarchaeota archaeon]|nr:hypothetical protein [Candidatus Heimdallarchaeota archaeon]